MSEIGKGVETHKADAGNVAASLHKPIWAENWSYVKRFRWIDLYREQRTSLYTLPRELSLCSKLLLKTDNSIVYSYFRHQKFFKKFRNQGLI